MSTSINDQIEHLKDSLEVAKAIQRLYPDAMLFQLRDDARVWVSDKVTPDRVEVIASVGDPHKREASAHFVAYTNVGAGRVYQRSMWPMHSHAALARLLETSPDAYAALVAVVSANG
jgi:hypothetical protein